MWCCWLLRCRWGRKATAAAAAAAAAAETPLPVPLVVGGGVARWSGEQLPPPARLSAFQELAPEDEDADDEHDVEFI